MAGGGDDLRRPQPPQCRRRTGHHAHRIPDRRVGEAASLSMGWTLDLVGLDENDFIRNCDATFKAAVKFVDWDHNADGTATGYYHPFSFPSYLQGYAPAYPFHRRSKSGGGGRSFAHSMLGSCAVLDANKSPRRPDANNLEGLFPYAYHVNAGLFAGYLRDYCTGNRPPPCGRR